MKYVEILTGNPILNAAIISWACAQIIKVILVLITERKLDLSRLFGSGGMPSSHAALVVALTVSVCKICGPHTAEFAISVVFALIVLYDASGVRRAAGEQAKVLNYMMDNWPNNTPQIFQNDLKELLGHTPLQVIAGSLLGAVVGLLL